MKHTMSRASTSSNALAKRAARAAARGTFNDPISMNEVPVRHGIVLNKTMYDPRELEHWLNAGRNTVPHSRRRLNANEANAIRRAARIADGGEGWHAAHTMFPDPAKSRTLTADAMRALDGIVRRAVRGLHLGAHAGEMLVYLVTIEAGKWVHAMVSQDRTGWRQQALNVTGGMAQLAAGLAAQAVEAGMKEGARRLAKRRLARAVRPAYVGLARAGLNRNTARRIAQQALNAR